MTGATIGKIAIVPFSKKNFLVNQRVGKFFLGEKPIENLPFIYCTLKQKDIISEIINKGQGSAQPNISNSDILMTSCYIPEKEKILTFNKLCKPYIEKILCNQYQNEKLISLKNYLLPKLMNGEIDVENIEL